MSQPQPGAEPPVAETPPGVPSPRGGEPAVPTDQPVPDRSTDATDGDPTPAEAAHTDPTPVETAHTDPTRTEAAGADPTPPDTADVGTGTVTAENRTAEAATAEPTTAAGTAPAPTRPDPPRWTGSAAVPPAARRDRPGRPVPAPRTPVGDLPIPAPEAAEPVDPWADADTDADAWALPATQYPPTLPYPEPEPAPGPAPTRPYPASSGPAPTRRYPLPPVPGPVPAPPAPARPTLPPARPATPPPVVSRPVPPPPAAPPDRSLKRRQRDRPQPQPAPPGWPAPQGYAPVAVRRKRRWPSRLLILTLLSIICCCGAPAYYGKPMWEQYPAKAALPDQVRDLDLRDDPASQRLSQRLIRETGEAHLLSEDLFAGVYSTGGKEVIVFGGTGFRLTPEQDVTDELTRLTPTYDLTGIEAIDTGVRGEYRGCGTGRLDGTAVVVCTWADHGSLGTAVFTRLSVTDSAILLGEFRESIVTRGA